jgi:hypothetical protein
MSGAIEDNLDQFIKTIGTFQSMKGSLDTNFYNGLKKIVNNAMKQVSDHTGEYLHNHLHKHQPDEDTLLKIIDNVPSSLSYEEEEFGYTSLPIQTLVYKESGVQYVPLLAKEGVKHNVGGNNGRGGLVGKYNARSKNVLQELVCVVGDDAIKLNVMKKVRESNLLRKKDIKEHGLLLLACHEETPMRFNYLADWCPEGLQTHKCSSGLPLSHAVINKSDDPIDCFSVFFEASLKHFPNDLGLLFQKHNHYPLVHEDSEGQTACERAFKEFGKDEALTAIEELIPFDDPKLPILRHHVAKHAPQYMTDFWNFRSRKRKRK